MLGFIWWCIKWTFATVFFVGIMALSGYYVFSRAAAGGSYVTVPDIVNQRIDRAVMTLQAQDLELGKPEAMSSDQPEGTVLAQRPPAGSVVRSGRKIFPTVSMAHTEEVPNLVGKTLAEAAELAHTYGLNVSANPARIPNPQPSNTVLSQDPPSGKRGTAVGTEISLLVSDGPRENLVMVPELTGRNESEVASLLEQLKLTGKREAVPAPEAYAGVVLDQVPAAGTYLQAGGEITYRVPATEVEKPKPQLRTRTVMYKPPFSWNDQELRFEVNFADEGAPKEVRTTTVKGGDISTRKIDVSFHEEVRIDIFVNGARVESQQYHGDAEPIITKY